MKFIFTSLSLLAVASAFELAWYDKIPLWQASCKNIVLTDGHVLRATCTNPAIDPATAQPTDLSIDLNTCFANYLGHLVYVPDGGFGSSCNSLLNGTKLIAECSAGQNQGSIYNEYELDDWHTIRMSGGDFVMQCGPMDGLEKRADNKQARPFVA
ncbi:hypothetical protein F4803DRAFT_551867 [Xylaria telfairii]|nr:hypothetical protein F4803DRAFT_551867 [Xylaria telfairii]